MRTALAMTNPEATLHFVHVLCGLLENEAEERIAAHRQLRQRILAALDGRHVHVDVLLGRPAEAIVAFARRVASLATTTTISPSPSSTP